MTTITIAEIQSDLTGYLRRVEAGEAFVVTDKDRPIAEIKPLEPTPNGQRPIGLCAGEFIVPDDFNDPLPEDILRDFGV
jgi:antitoxin (DNA-binding transcriptional repressor) of toxin-antitoxin stability system